MSVFDKIYQRAKSRLTTIVLPEGEEPRVISAGAYAAKKKLARIILLGKTKIIVQKARSHNLDIKKVELVEPRKDEKLDEYIQSYWNLRKHKGIGLDDAQTLLLSNFVFFGAMMLRTKRVDGFVAGASHTTSDVARAALHCLNKDSQYNTVSGSFLIEIKDRGYGEKGLFLFADCGIVPLPSTRQLADIALTSAGLWAKVTGYKPRVAMLSFSSKGSSFSDSVLRVRKATAKLKKLRPDLIIDGELQVDSAIVPRVAKIKVPDSPLAGKANILIFPSLDAGNIAYKLMQRLARARAVGPIIQGLSQSCSDLSRGTSPREIVDTIAVTAVRAQ